MENHVYDIWLSLHMPVGRTYSAKLINTFGDAYEVYRAEPEEIERAKIPSKESAYLSYKDLDKSYDIIRFCEKNDIKIIAYGSPDYPSRLANIDNPPALLYVKGKIPEDDNRVAVVGTRHMSAYGMRQAFGFSYGMTKGGCTVVSGLAAGIDGVAAVGALEAGGRTVAVLGCGLDMVFPEEHSGLARAVSENGALITEYPPGSLPLSSHFPERNRIISGLSDAVLVIEGGDKSGSVITAHLALKQERKLFVLPGDVDKSSCIGSNELFREGAVPALNAGDILEYFEQEKPGSVDVLAYAESACDRAFGIDILKKYGVTPSAEALPKQNAKQTTRRQITRQVQDIPVENKDKTEKNIPPEGRLRDFWSVIPNDKRVGADGFIQSGYGVNEAMNLLSMLEISGFVKSIPGGMFVKI